MMTQSHIFRMKARSYSKDTSANRNRPFVKAKLISEVEEISNPDSEQNPK